MLTAKRLSVVCAASILALSGLAAQTGQQPAGGAPPAGAAAKRAPGGGVGGEAGGGQAAAESGPRLDLEFKGGTVGEFVAMLRSLPGLAVNAIVAADTEKLPLGRISLKQVTLTDAMQVIETASQREGDLVLTGVVEQRGGLWLVSSTARDAFRGRPGAVPGARGSTVVVFNITGPGGPTTPPEVTLSAVEAAVQMIEAPGDKTQISFHKESGLLFVVGGPLAQESVRNVIQSIGANRNAQLLKEELTAARSIMSILGVPDLTSAEARIKDLQGAKKAAEEMRLEAATVEARLLTQVKMGAEEIARLRERLDKTEDEVRKAEAMGRHAAETVQKHNEDLGAANQKLSAELNQTREELRQAQAKLQDQGTKR